MSNRRKRRIVYDEDEEKPAAKRQRYTPHNFQTPEGTDPKRWQVDGQIVARREKELAKGYSQPVYKEYVSTIRRCDRIPDIHPITPNKWLAVARRSWDTQVRTWRRALHDWKNVMTNLGPLQLTETKSDTKGEDGEPGLEEETKGKQDLEDGKIDPKEAEKEDQLKTSVVKEELKVEEETTPDRPQLSKLLPDEEFVWRITDEIS